MPSKNQAFCSRCMDFIYPVVEAAEPNAALVLRTKKKRPRVGPSTLLGISVPRLLLRGLVNMGNTCFLNAVLQAFAHNRMLQDYFFVARTHDTVICQQRRRLRAAEPSARPSVCLGCELAAFMGSLIPPLDGSGGVTDRAASTSPVVPHGILEALWTVFPSFIGTEQHDAHELLIALLGGLHSHTHPRVFVQDGRSPRFTPRGRSLCDCPVHQHFSGVLRSELECAECGTVSHKFDPFLDISLSLDDLVASSDQDSSTISLDTLLRKFTADEELRDVNQVYCPRCSKYRTAVKRLCIRTLPNVLAFHIRRLDFYKQRKLGAFVQFPLKALDMQKFTVPPAEAPDAEVDSLRASIPMLQLDMFSGTNTGPYDLAAVINHHGESVDGGHYTTFVADDHNARLASSKKRNQWFLVDDDQVSPATEDQVRESQAYVALVVQDVRDDAHLSAVHVQVHTDLRSETSSRPHSRVTRSRILQLGSSPSVRE